MKWQTIAEELKQNPSGFVAHFAVAFGAVILAAFWWGPDAAVWRWVVVWWGAFGVAWELIGYLATGRRWIPSVLGLVSYWLGAIAATAAIIWRP